MAGKAVRKPSGSRTRREELQPRRAERAGGVDVLLRNGANAGPEQLSQVRTGIQNQCNNQLPACNRAATGRSNC